MSVEWYAVADRTPPTMFLWGKCSIEIGKHLADDHTHEHWYEIIREMDLGENNLYAAWLTDIWMSWLKSVMPCKLLWVPDEIVDEVFARGGLVTGSRYISNWEVLPKDRIIWSFRLFDVYQEPRKEEEE